MSLKWRIAEDFISYKLNSIIVFLYEFDIISENYYFEYIYGTTDLTIIKLVRFGLSVNVITKLTKDSQIKNLDFDNNGNLFIKNRKSFDIYLSKQPELFKFEIRKYIS